MTLNLDKFEDILKLADQTIGTSKKKVRRKKSRRKETMNGAGYTYVYDGEGKMVGKHRVIMEERIGRKLLSHEAVYFVNGDKTDFSVGNLVLGMKPGKHRIVWCPHCKKDIFDLKQLRDLLAKKGNTPAPVTAIDNLFGGGLS